MKLNFVILLLPAASAFSHVSHHHHKSHEYQNKTLPSRVGEAPYGISNGTATFGSSGFLTAPTGSAGKAIYSTVVITKDGPHSTIIESGPASLNEAGTSLSFPSSCAQVTVTVAQNTTVTVTVSASESGTVEPAIPTQAPVPVQAGTSSSVEPITASPTEASSSILLPSVNSAVTLAAIGAEPSSSAPAPAVADTSSPVSTAPVVAPTSSPSSTVKAAAISATTPATASATVPATAPATNPAKSAKRGIIVSGDDTDAITAAFANTKVSWLGNWYSEPPPNLTPDMGMSFVPQMYSPQYVKDGSWASNAKKGVAAGEKYFMSFGEPAHSHITAETAVTYWMQNMEPYAAQGVSLGAPGNLQNPVDFVWLGDFLDLCEKAGCTIGFVCVHWFWTPGPNGQEEFKNVVTNATTMAKGKPVWVDNFEATGDNAGQIEFLTNVIPWLEDNDLVARYGYLGLNRTTGGFLPETGNELSDLGKFYATF